MHHVMLYDLLQEVKRVSTCAEPSVVADIDILT